MSRDAKVGLVIVFAFVFIFGTILVHRLHSSGGDPSARASETASDGAGDAGAGQASTLGDGSTAVQAVSEPAATTVDAVAVTPETSHAGYPSGSDIEAAQSASVNRQGPLTLSPVANEPPGAIGEVRSSASAASGSRLAPRSVEGPGTSGEASPSYGGGGAQIILSASPSNPQPGAVAGQKSQGSSLQSNTGRDAIMAAIDPSEGDSRAASSRNVLMQIPNSRTTVAGNPAIGTESRATERGQHALGNDKSEEETSDSVMPSDDANLESSLTPEATVLDAGQEQELERGPLTRQQLSVNSQGNARTQLSPHSSQFPAAEPVIESIPDRELDPNPFVPAGSAEPSSQSDSGRRAGFPLAREQSELGFRTYEVREGDSFWTISARFYGTGKHFRTLEQLNADRLSSAGGRMILRPGTEILLPDLATLRSHKPAGSAAAAGVELPSNVSKDSLRTGGSQLKPQAAGGRGDGFEASSRSDSSSTGRTYRVREADTLSTIAERLLGSAKRWEEIYQLNQQQLSDPNRLIPGMELQIPAGRTPEKIADRLPEGR